MSDIVFQSQHWLWALLALPLIAAALVAWALGARRARTVWADPQVLPIGTPGRTRAMRGVAAVLALLAIAAGIVAMARPSTVATEDEQRSTVMLVVDVSTSMNRTDLAPSRLAAAVDAAGRFIDEAPDDTSVGLISFADGARVVVAPTRDRDRVRSSLADLETVHGETALGEAVVTGLGSLQSVGAITPGGEPSESAGRILVLTDGVDTARNATSPAQASERAAADGVPLYPILLGDDAGSPGQATPAETLSAMATRTGGVFAQSVNTADLQAVFADIGTIIAPVERLRELTVWCVAAALVLLALAAGALALGHPGRASAAPAGSRRSRSPGASQPS